MNVLIENCPRYSLQSRKKSSQARKINRHLDKPQEDLRATQRQEITERFLETTSSIIFLKSWVFGCLWRVFSPVRARDVSVLRKENWIFIKKKKYFLLMWNSRLLVIKNKLKHYRFKKDRKGLKQIAKHRWKGWHNSRWVSR